MSNWDWKECKEDFALLLEAGFIAVHHADEDSAMKLFKAAEVLNPNQSATKLGMGYLYLHMLDLKKASKLYEEVLEAEPNNETAKALLGVCMTLNPDTADKGEKLLLDIHHSKDKAIQNLSDTGLDFINRFIKKSPSPIEGPKRK